MRAKSDPTHEQKRFPMPGFSICFGDQNFQTRLTARSNRIFHGDAEDRPLPYTEGVRLLQSFEKPAKNMKLCETMGPPVDGFDDSVNKLPFYKCGYIAFGQN